MFNLKTLVQICAMKNVSAMKVVSKLIVVWKLCRNILAIPIFLISYMINQFLFLNVTTSRGSYEVCKRVLKKWAKGQNMFCAGKLSVNESYKILLIINKIYLI